MTEPNRQLEAKEERIIEIEIERLRPFKEHPFQVKDGLKHPSQECFLFKIQQTQSACDGSLPYLPH